MASLYPYEIKHRYSGVVLYTAQIELGPDQSESLRLGAAVKAAYLARADLAGANLAGANLTRANLTGANLDGARLTGARLTRANLTGANLARAYLDGANLAGAYLARADLAGANLARAYLDGAYLDGANLTRANLTRAYLAGAYLDGAYLARAKCGQQIIRTIIQGPTRYDGYSFLMFCFEDGTDLIHAGCQAISLASFRERAAGYTSEAKRAATDLILDYLDAASKLEGFA